MSTITVTTPARPDDGLTLLPQPARDKLERLRAARDDAYVLLDAANDKATALRTGATLANARTELTELEKADSRNLLFRDTNSLSEPQAASDGPPPVDRRPERDTARLEAARERVERLEAELVKVDALRKHRSEAWQAMSRLVSNIEEWLRGLSAALEPVESESVKLAKGKKPEDELFATRELIAALAADRKRTERASLPASEAKMRARMLVTRHAEQVRVTGLAARSGTPEVVVANHGQDQGFALLCWLNPQAVIRRLEAEIDSQSNDRLALSELDLARKLKEIDERLLLTERREEALVELVEQAGGDVARRPAADPRAVLGLA